MQTVELVRTNSKAGGSNPAAPQSLAAAGLRGFFGIAEKWGLGEKENLLLLGEPGRATYYNWKKGEVGKISRDTLERLSYLVGIYKALQILIPDKAMADARKGAFACRIVSGRQIRKTTGFDQLNNIASQLTNEPS